LAVVSIHFVPALPPHFRMSALLSKADITERSQRVR